MRRLLLLSMLLLLVGCEPAKLPTPFHASDVSANFRPADFKLSDQYGKTRQLSDFRGKAVVVFFGYTNCPDVCPTTLADLTQVLQQLGEQAKQVQVLFVTVDPERDTADRLGKYIAGFDASFLALSGSLTDTEQAAKVFKVSYKKQPLEEGYYVDHTMGLFLLDMKGNIRLHAPHAQRTEWLVDDLRLLLKGA